MQWNLNRVAALSRGASEISDPHPYKWCPHCQLDLIDIGLIDQSLWNPDRATYDFHGPVDPTSSSKSILPAITSLAVFYAIEQVTLVGAAVANVAS